MRGEGQSLIRGAAGGVLPAGRGKRGVNGAEIGLTRRGGFWRINRRSGMRAQADVAERQTRMVQDHVPARVWRFKSSHRHRYVYLTSLRVPFHARNGLFLYVMSQFYSQ